MKLYPIKAGNFKLDGGAMFGVVPKVLWSKTNPADQNNLIDIAARCLLIEDGDRLTLIDAGMGNKQSEKFFSYYSLWGDDSLDKSLKEKGFQPEFGARPVKRTIQKEVLNSLSKEILAGKVSTESIILLDEFDDNLVFRNQTNLTL